MPTRTATETDGLVIPQFVTSVNHDGERTYLPDTRPLPARTTKIGDGLLTPPMVGELRRNSTARPADDTPLYTVAASGNHHYLTVPPGAFYMKNFTSRGDGGEMSKPVATDPLGSITTRDHHSLVIPYRKGSTAYRAGERPLDTIATREAHALATLAIDVQDCLFRMLKPREHLRGQRFPDPYVVLGNSGEQTMQAGNVVPDVAQWIGTAIVEVLS